MQRRRLDLAFPSRGVEGELFRQRMGTYTLAKRNLEHELTAVLPVPYWTVGDATFPERLKRLRLVRGMTQKELALAAGCAWNVVYRWERGFNGAAPRTLKRVAGVLGVEPADLVRQ